MPEISTTGDQMLNVLLAIARRGPATTTEIAVSLGINRTVAHRLVSTLHARAFVRRQRDGYVVGPTVVRLARSVEPDLRQVALPAMTRLRDATGETVVLHTIDAGEAVVVDQVVGDRHVLRVQHQPGSRHQLGQGASGRALLAFQPDSLIAPFLRAAGQDRTLLHLLAEVRRRGHASSAEELQPGVHGMAAPILARDGSARASIAVLVPAERAGSLTRHADGLRDAAQEIAAALCHPAL